MLLFFSHVYSPSQGQTTHWGQNFMTPERHFLFAHMLQVSKWSLRNLILYTFLMIFYMYIAQGKGTKPLRNNFWCQQKALITSTFCCKFQTNLFEFWFYTHFLMFFPQGQTTLCGQNSDVNRKVLSFCPFVASFKTISLKSDFINTYFCLFLYIYIALGQKPTTPWVRIFILT